MRETHESVTIGPATSVATQEIAARYKGMFPKRAGKPELGEVGFVPAEDGAWLRPKNEASLHAYSCVASRVAAARHG